MCRLAFHNLNHMLARLKGMSCEFSFTKISYVCCSSNRHPNFVLIILGYGFQIQSHFTLDGVSLHDLAISFLVCINHDYL